MQRHGVENLIKASRAKAKIRLLMATLFRRLLSDTDCKKGSTSAGADCPSAGIGGDGSWQLMEYPERQLAALRSVQIAARRSPSDVSDRFCASIIIYSFCLELHWTRPSSVLSQRDTDIEGFQDEGPQ